jgi:ketol-acid reductoisomerase
MFMPAKMYYDDDADLGCLKDKTIAIVGYGAQGHAHAQNLRDSGVNVIVAELEGTANYAMAKEHGFEPVSADAAAKEADLLSVLVADTAQPGIYAKLIEPNLKKGAALLFSHGFNIHFQCIEPSKETDVIMVAPKGPGTLVREEYERGAGVPVLVAVYQDATGKAHDLALAYAKGIGGTRAGAIETTFEEETETDLFGEQVVLCGGVSELVKAGFETLVDAGYQPEIAYFECMHELKLIVDLFYVGGLSWMRHVVSETAEYGDYSRGGRVIDKKTKKRMKQMLAEIRSGEFAREWIGENQVGCPVLKASRRHERELLLEKTGRRLRKLMSWIDAKEVE